MEFARLLLEYLTQGGAAAVITILVAAIGVLIWDRRALVKSLTETTQLVYNAKDKETNSIREILDRYHEGNLNLVQALNEIKNVLITVQMKK